MRIIAGTPDLVHEYAQKHMYGCTLNFNCMWHEPLTLVFKLVPEWDSVVRIPSLMKLEIAQQVLHKQTSENYFATYCNYTKAQYT